MHTISCFVGLCALVGRVGLTNHIVLMSSGFQPFVTYLLLHKQISTLYMGLEYIMKKETWT